MNHTLILCIVVCVFLSRVNGSLFGTDQPLISEADILRFEKSYQTELKAKKKSNKIPKTSSRDWEKPVESVSVPRVTPSNDRPKQSKQAGMEKSKDKNGVAIKEKTFFSKSQPRSIEDGNEKPAKKLRFQRLSRSVSSQPSTQNSSKRKSFWVSRNCCDCSCCSICCKCVWCVNTSNICCIRSSVYVRSVMMVLIYVWIYSTASSTYPG